MVGVRGFGIDNTYPSRLTLVLLGFTQTGITLLLEPVARAWCARAWVWRTVITVESRVMTIYLWHLTALGVLAALSLHLGG